MADAIDVAHALHRATHIGAGIIAVVLFWFPLLSKKGGRLHVASGRVFAWCAIVVGVTGVVSAAWALLHPVSFAALGDAPPEDTAPVIANLRFIFSLMVFLSLGVLCGTVFGVRVVRAKQDHAALGSTLLFTLLYAFAVASGGLVIFGGWMLARGGTGLYVVHVVLGIVGLYGVRGDLQYIRQPATSRDEWMFAHIEHMVSVGIGLYMAFMLFGVNQLHGFDLPAIVRLGLVLLPAVVGYPAMSIGIGRLRRRGEDGVAPLLQSASRPDTDP